MTLATTTKRLIGNDTSVHFTLVSFEGLFKDPVSRNNPEFQTKITEFPNLGVINGTLVKIGSLT